MAYGKEIMAGISGADGVIAAAAGREVEGEREMGEAMEDSDEEFADAVEMVDR
jgi:hypothetical protein